MAKVKLYENEKLLKMYFYDMKMTPEQIAEKLGCSPRTIRTNLKKYGIR